MEAKDLSSRRRISSARMGKEAISSKGIRITRDERAKRGGRGEGDLGQRTVSVKRNHLFQVLMGSLDPGGFVYERALRLYIYDLYSSVCLLYFNKGNALKGETELSVKYMRMEERWSGAAGREKTYLEGLGKQEAFQQLQNAPWLGARPENCNDKGGGTEWKTKDNSRRP